MFQQFHIEQYATDRLRERSAAAAAYRIARMARRRGPAECVGLRPAGQVATAATGPTAPTPAPATVAAAAATRADGRTSPSAWVPAA